MYFISVLHTCVAQNEAQFGRDEEVEANETKNKK